MISNPKLLTRIIKVIQKILDLPSKMKPSSNMLVGLSGHMSLALRNSTLQRMTYADAKSENKMAR
jgi:hypothetical protein